MMANLPVDVIIDIFLRLPAKTLLCLKIVCKLWYDIITDNYFVNLHLEQSLATKTNLHYVVTTPRMYLQTYDHLSEPLKTNCPVLYSADFDSFDSPLELSHPFKSCKTGVWVLESCRGLLLLRVGGGNLLLYNPTTQTYNELPALPYWSPVRSYHHFVYGFGYDSVSEDYKCVRIMQFFYKETGFMLREVMVYSLKNNCWKKVPDVPCYFNPRNRGSGTLVHEMLHWVGTNTDDIFEVIVAFNLRDETFRCLPLPNYQFEPYDDLCVGMLDGCLCLLANRQVQCNVWVMKEYGTAGSWTRMFTFEKRQCDNLERPIGYSVDKRGLLFVKNLFRLTYIDLESMEHTDVTFSGCNRGLDGRVYVENLLMLDYAEFADGFHSRKEQHGRRKRKNLC